MVAAAVWFFVGGGGHLGAGARWGRGRGGGVVVEEDADVGADRKRQRSRPTAAADHPLPKPFASQQISIIQSEREPREPGDSLRCDLTPAHRACTPSPLP